MLGLTVTCRRLLGTTVLAYTLGLRHALDADHISAIDLMTRRLLASGQQPVTVGTWFSLGHSTIVVITSIAVAGTAAGLSEHFESFSRVGGIIGTSVSAAFLIILGALNLFILWRAVWRMHVLIYGDGNDSGDEEIPGTTAQEGLLQGSGCLMNIFKGAFRIVDRPWKMYPLGILCACAFTACQLALR